MADRRGLAGGPIGRMKQGARTRSLLIDIDQAAHCQATLDKTQPPAELVDGKGGEVLLDSLAHPGKISQREAHIISQGIVVLARDDGLVALRKMVMGVSESVRLRGQGR